jgi:dTDP-glucose 4,6-dehydratase
LRVAVLGSNSFIGSDLIDLLLDDDHAEVLGISRSPEKPPEFLAYGRRPRERFRFVQADLKTDVSSAVRTLDAFEPEYVVNFAAQGDDVASWSYPRDFFETNCAALVELIDALKGKSYPRRFLQLSSSSVYGQEGASPRTEEAALAPASPYGVSKAAADLLLLAYYERHGFPAQIVRPPNVYGPNQELFRIIPRAIVSLKSGTTLQLHGGGHAMRSYLYVRDLSRAIVLLLRGGRAGEVYNVAPAAEVRVRDIVASVCDLLGKDFDEFVQVTEDRPGQQSGVSLDWGKIKAEVGWEPQWPLRDGIRSVYDWIEREWELVDRFPLSYVHRP